MPAASFVEMAFLLVFFKAAVLDFALETSGKMVLLHSSPARIYSVL
jgi:hypothetical protein